MDAHSYGSTVRSRSSHSIIVCRVWCPSENRCFANRVQNNGPTFAIDSPLKPGRAIKDSAQCAHLEQPATCAEESSEDSKAVFCGSCSERQYACVCHDTALEDLETGKEGTEDLKCSGPETGEHLAPLRDQIQEGHVPRDDVIKIIAVHPSTQDAIQCRRQHRKDNRRRKWERLRAQKSQDSTPKPFDRGATVVEAMMSGLADSYNILQ